MLALVAALMGLIPTTVAFYDTFASQLPPCPMVYPQPDVDIHKLLGPWHLSLVVMDAAEDFVETVVCVSGEFERHNLSSFQQVWTLQTATDRNEPMARVDLPTTVVRSGVWAIHSPLGDLKAVVFDSDPQAYVLISHCGWFQGVLVHLWTSALTRSRVLSPVMQRFLISALEDNGFHSSHSKIVSWQGC